MKRKRYIRNRRASLRERAAIAERERAESTRRGRNMAPQAANLYKVPTYTPLDAERPQDDDCLVPGAVLPACEAKGGAQFFVLVAALILAFLFIAHYLITHLLSPMA